MPFRDPSYFTSLFVKNLETTSRDELSYWRLLVTYTVQKAFPVHMPTWRLIPVPARNYGMFRAKSSTTTMKRIDTHIPWGTQARSKYFSHCLVHPTGLSPSKKVGKSILGLDIVKLKDLSDSVVHFSFSSSLLMNWVPEWCGAGISKDGAASVNTNPWEYVRKMSSKTIKPYPWQWCLPYEAV